MDKFKFILNITFTLVLTLFLLVFTTSTGFSLYTRITEHQNIDQIDEDGPDQDPVYEEDDQVYDEMDDYDDE